jgi:hypothetical protein
LSFALRPDSPFEAESTLAAVSFVSHLAFLQYIWSAIFQGDGFVSTAKSASISSSCVPLLILFSLAVLMAASSVSAQEDEGSDKQNVLSLILGGTSDRDENVFTVGLDFEHRVHPLLGVGAVIEYATDDIDALTLIGALDFHLWRGLAIQTGPGVEFVGEEEEEAGRTTSSNRREFVYRVGVVYEFEIGKLLVTPQVHYDYSTGNDAVVYATALGFKF